MSSAKRRSFLTVFSISVLLWIAVSIAFLLDNRNLHYAFADESDRYNYTIVTNVDGEQSYSVSVRTAAKPNLVSAVIPDTYNGLPVTEIANNGFMSCINLQKVVLPDSVKKIGNNAFMNCTKLERVMLPKVESIGMNAFAMCSKLDRTYIPNTVKSVGANLFRNNANTVFVQDTEDEVAAEWQSTWSSYFTGDIVYGIESENTVNYKQILDSESGNVIGYEVAPCQMISTDNDIVIYNSFREDDSSEYLPVLNICSEAFTYSSAKSVILRDRHTVDEAAPIFNHNINIRSNAFFVLFANDVSIEVDVSFDHPAGLQDVSDSMHDGREIVGDAEGHSIGIFEEAQITSVTLPSSLDYIPERMFYGCPYLNSIVFYGQEYDGTNILEHIIKVGDGAFNSCVSLTNLSIPSSVTEMGESVFYDWGYDNAQQILNIDFREDNLPEGWSENWLIGIHDNVKINYTVPVEITVDFQDDVGTKIVISVVPGKEMEKIDRPVRKGYTFTGIYSEKIGGLQYYSDNMTVRKPWENGDPYTIYAQWEIVTYDINYHDDIKNLPNNNPKTYTVEDSFYIEPVIYNGFEYSFIPNRIEKGMTGNINVKYIKQAIDYNIEYIVDDVKGNLNSNPEKYNVTHEVVFTPFACEGYTFTWTPASIPIGSMGDITVVGTWMPNEYKITYSVWSGTIHSNPSTYLYGQTLELSPAVYGGYYVEWDQNNIPAGTIGDVTVKAQYIEKSLNQSYENGIYEIWTNSQFEQLKDQPNGGSGRIYRLMSNLYIPQYQSKYLEPISEFRGTFNGHGHMIYGYDLDTSSGGNLGFCKINHGVITNLTLGIRFNVGTQFSDINIGTFAGVNKGTISYCSIYAAFNRPFFRCFAKGDSYMGCFVGSNEGTIDSCTGGDWLDGTCNMGTIAGKNSGTIKNCSAGNSNQNIDFRYSDYNACIGGIVGLQTAGMISNCSFEGRIRWTANYDSERYPDSTQNREMQPCIGIMIGYKKGGSISGSSWQTIPGYDKYGVVVSTFEPDVVTWTTGSLWWTETHTHDQGLYFKNEECGRID